MEATHSQRHHPDQRKQYQKGMTVGVAIILFSIVSGILYGVKMYNESHLVNSHHYLPFLLVLLLGVAICVGTRLKYHR